MKNSKVNKTAYNNDEALIDEAIGLFEKEDYGNAVTRLKELAQEGFDEAQFYLGRCYEDGLGVEQDHGIAFFWYFKAALQGDSDYQNNLGWCYNEGMGITRSDREAEHWYRLSAEAGNEKGQCNLGIMYMSEPYADKAPEGFQWLKKAVRKKYAPAELNLGLCYLEGTGTRRNLEKALHYFMLSGEHGEGDGYNNAAICYQNGYGVEVDEVKALELFTKAAGMDSPEGNINLGYCYEKGIGTEIDFTNAFIHFSNAADMNDEVAMYKLGTMYENELYYGKDYGKALEWYQKAYKNGFDVASEAYIRLNNKLQTAENPDRIEKNEALYKTCCDLFDQGKFKESYKGFGKLAECSHPGAMLHLGEIFLHAATLKTSVKEVEFNREQAFKWFYRAVNQGYPEAFYRLARCFEEGTGTLKNTYRARFWALKAIEKGVPGASELIDRLG